MREAEARRQRHANKVAAQAAARKKAEAKPTVVPKRPKEAPKKGALPRAVEIRRDLRTIAQRQAEEVGREARLMMEVVNDEATRHRDGNTTFARFRVKDFDKWFKSHVSYCNFVKDMTGKEKGWEALHAAVLMSPIENFYVGTTLILNLNDYNNHHYQPDFTYTIGYADWRPDTFGLTYSNYANNKFYPKKSKDHFNFDEGTWEVNYKTRLDPWRVQAAYRYTPFIDKKMLKVTASGMLHEKVHFSAAWDHYFNYPQERLTLSGKAFVFDRLFASGSVYLYSSLERQTDLEPDYAYSFGWYDHRPYHLSFTYTNYYMPTRWWWRDLHNRPIFDDGFFCVEMNLKH